MQKPAGASSSPAPSPGRAPAEPRKSYGDSVHPAIPSKCVMTGDGMVSAMVRQTAVFTIEARDAEGNKPFSGGEKFTVSVRGSSQVRARVTDKEDGTYEVHYKPSTSGTYSIAVSLNGVPLPDSPMKVDVLTPAPYAPKCVLKGDALYKAKAREVAQFEVEFVDALGQPARAEELDVWVEKILDPDEPGELGAEEATEGVPLGEVPVAAAGSPTATQRTGGDAKTSRTQRSEALARSGGRVEVGDKPLLLRAEYDLDSELVTVLRQGQMVTVLEERPMPEDGKVRARVAVIEEDPAARSIAESWWSPFDPTTVEDIIEQTSPRELATVRSLAMSSARFSETGSVATSFALMSMADTARARKKRGGQKGWVTITKDGSDLVAQRPRLNAGERRRYLELWQSREAADRAAKSQANNQSSKSGVEQKIIHHVGPSYAHEIVADPRGIAFAFGGIHPGTLHAAGKIVRTHSVKYNIGAAGKYKLHVGLRQQAVALPNSPFDLVVAPANAHAPSTNLPHASLPLLGTVGDDWSCESLLQVSDRMGNKCTAGHAPITVDVEGDSIVSACEDNENGTYMLKWKGKVSGTFKTQVKIDGAHVLGSPTTIRMRAGPPDVSKCEISGGGLKTALAGQAATVQISCKDRFSNPLSSDSLGQGSELRFGLALLPPSSENRVLKESVTSMNYDGRWAKLEGAVAASVESSNESFEISYVAEEAGDFELHVWCDPDGSGGARQWLTGSPFGVRVSGIAPSNTGSNVGSAFVGDGAQAVELKGCNVTAGEEVKLKPQLRDQYGNASAAQVDPVTGKSTFEVFLTQPDGSQLPLQLNQLKGLGLYEVMRELTMKGEHKLSFLLNKEHITESPVIFNVVPALAIGSKSQLFPPSEPPFINTTCVILLEAIDKFGNKLDKGGARVDARANGPGVSACVPEDRGDGTYTISFSAAVVGETRVIVRLDNVEMAPLKLVFVSPNEGAAKGKKGGAAADAKADDGAAPPPAPAPEIS